MRRVLSSKWHYEHLLLVYFSHRNLDYILARMSCKIETDVLIVIFLDWYADFDSLEVLCVEKKD